MLDLMEDWKRKKKVQAKTNRHMIWKPQSIKQPAQHHMGGCQRHFSIFFHAASLRINEVLSSAWSLHSVNRPPKGSHPRPT